MSDLEGTEVVPSGAVQGNFAVFGTDGVLADPGVSPSDFYPKATTDEKIADALVSVEQFVSDQHALASYKASAWSASTEYAENDYCQYGGKGYRCVVAHTSGAGFAPTKWQLVLSVAGKAAIDAVLAPYSSDDKARLLDLCSAYNSSTTYAKGQMVLQDGVLKICTTAGRGAAAVFSAGTVDEAIKQRLKVVGDSLAEKAAASAVDSPYDTTSSGYAVGATCTHDGKWYRCIAAVAVGAVWSDANWTPITVKQAIEDGSAQVQSNWEETDPNSPAYIRNKPTIDIPEIDASLSEEGAAADAKAVGDALAQKVGIDNLPFKIVNLLPTGSTSGTTITYTLSDHSINIIEGNNGNALSVAAGKTLRLVPPSSPTSTEEGVVLARDFFVVFNVASDDDVSVSVDGLALRDHAGNSVTVVAPNERRAVYRFTEFARSGSVFLVSLEADPAWLAIQDIERALDAILADGGSFEFTPGMYLFNEGNGRYYKLSAVTDPETGETNIATDQEGVLK